MADATAAGATAPRLQLQAGHLADGPAQRVRPAAQGGPAPDRAAERRADRAGDAAAQARGPEAARRADHDPAAGEGVRREEGGGLRHRRAGGGPLPHQHLPAARHPRLRLPRHPVRGEDDPGAGTCRRCWRRSPCAPRGLVLVTGRHRLGQVHLPRGDDQPREPEPPGQRHHDRGPDRVPPPRRECEHLAARGGQRHAVASPRRCATCCGRTPT